MRVFKSSYRTREGERVKTVKWYVEFRDHNGDIRRLPAFTSKGASEEFGRNVDRLVAYHRATGGQTDPGLQRWLTEIPAGTRRRLLEIGALDSERAAVMKPLAEHLADFRGALEARGNTSKHVEAVCNRAARIFEGCRCRYYSDINATKVQAFLCDLREGEEKLSAQTFNYYLGSLKSFCRWMIKNRRATSSPVSHLDPLNVKTDRRHDRRALSVEELLTLLSKTAAAEPRSKMTGVERAMLYRVAIETGLRANELRSLSRKSFALAADPPTVTVAAAYSKHRREDVLPIRPALANDLGGFFGQAEEAGNGRAFKVPSEYRVAEMLRADLKHAREEWVKEATSENERAAREKSDFLRYRDAAGKVVDFQALRHTFITCLALGGVHPKTAQTMARHSTITLTMDRYSHTLKGAEVEALKTLPSIPSSHDHVPASSGNVSAFCLALPERFRESGSEHGRLNGARDGHGSERTKSPSNTGKTAFSTVADATMDGPRPRGGMADAADLKSDRRNGDKCVAGPTNTGHSDTSSDRPRKRLGVLLGAIPEHDRDLLRLLELWPQLPQGIRTAILSLITAAFENGPNLRPADQESTRQGPSVQRG